MEALEEAHVELAERTAAAAAAEQQLSQVQAAWDAASAAWAAERGLLLEARERAAAEAGRGAEFSRAAPPPAPSAATSLLAEQLSALQAERTYLVAAVVDAKSEAAAARKEADNAASSLASAEARAQAATAAAAAASAHSPRATAAELEALHQALATEREEAAGQRAMLSESLVEAGRLSHELSQLRTSLAAQQPAEAGGSVSNALRLECEALRSELAQARSAAAHSLARADADAAAGRMEAEQRLRALEAKLAQERGAGARSSAAAAKALSQAESLSAELERLRVSEREREAQASGHAAPPAEAAFAERDAMRAKLEAALGRVGQLQRALASAANHAADAESRWAEERQRHSEEMAKLAAELSAAQSGGGGGGGGGWMTPPNAYGGGGPAGSPGGAMTEADRRRLTLEMDVKLAISAKQAADASRRLASTEAERRRLAEENEALRKAAADSGLLALLGLSEQDVANAMSCAPVAALGDVVENGKALGSLLEEALMNGVAQLAEVAGASAGVGVRQLEGSARAGARAVAAVFAEEERDDRAIHYRKEVARVPTQAAGGRAPPSRYYAPD